MDININVFYEIIKYADVVCMYNQFQNFYDPFENQYLKLISI